MKKNNIYILIFTVLLTLGIIGCSDSNTAVDPDNNDINNNDDSNANSFLGEEPEEVTIRISAHEIFVEEENFQKYYVEPIADVYPHITIEQAQVTFDEIEDHFLARTTPDIFAGWNGGIAALIEHEINTDILPYVESTGSDLNRFVQATIDTATVDGELYGLPYAQQFNALYYNKDIFDMFGVEYPEDGMTWADTIDLAKKVTGELNDVQYRGLTPGGVWRLLNPLNLGSLIEYGSLENLASSRSEDLITVLETAQQIYNIPGNAPADLENLMNEGGDLQEFLQGNVAMLASMNRISSFEDIDWGVAQYPSYPQAPDTYESVDAHYHFLLSTSEHPEEAFKVIDYLSSPEHQELLVKETNIFPALDDTNLMMTFVEENEYAKGKDFTGVFKSSPAEASILHGSSWGIRDLFVEKVTEMIEEGKDVNTAFLEMEEEIDIMLEDYTGKE